MYDYGTFSFESKAQVLELAKKYWNPDKTQFWTDAGVDLVIDRREGYFLWDMGGRRLIDMHLNGGTYNLGHRNPRSDRRRSSTAMQYFDIGNHHFPSVARTALAQRLVDIGARVDHQGGLRIRRRRGDRHRAQERPARHPAAQDRLDRQGLPRAHRPGGRHRRRPVRQAVPLRPARRVRAGAVRRRRRDGAGPAGGDVAAVIMETIPATYGFPLPPAGYLEAVKELVRTLRRALHRRRGADRSDAHRRDVGHHQARHRAGHHGHRQGPVRRHVPDHRGAAQRAGRAVARRGRLRPHLDLRRRRARLRRRDQDPGDHQPARGPRRTCTRITDAVRRRAGPHPGRPLRTGSSASGRTAS